MRKVFLLAGLWASGLLVGVGIESRAVDGALDRFDKLQKLYEELKSEYWTVSDDRANKVKQLNSCLGEWNATIVGFDGQRKKMRDVLKFSFPDIDQ